MPKLPDFTALGGSPVPQRAGGVASYELADTRQAGAGLITAGNQVEQASDMMQRVAERATEELRRTNERQDAIVAEGAVNTLRRKALDLQAEFQQVKGAGVVGQQFLDGYQQRFDDQREQIGRALSERQRQMFDLKAPQTDYHYRAALMSHQGSETAAFNNQTEADTVEFARRQIFANPTDLNAIKGGLAQIDWAIDQRGQRMGWAPVSIAETKARYRERVWEDAAGILVERDPRGSLAALDKRMGIGSEPGPSGIAAFDSIDAKKLVELRTRAASHVAQAENRARAEGEKRLKEAQDTAKELNTFVLTGQMVDPTYEQQVIAKVAGTPFEAPARALIGMSFMGAAHGSQTVPQQEASLRQMDAQLSATGSSPEQQKLVQQARQITEAQVAAYKENPWAAAARFGRQTPVSVEQIGKAADVPQIVAHRLGLMTGVETYAGRPVSPLQPEEAKAFAEQLKTLTPDARAEVLAQTGAMLSAPRIEALGEQLDKHDKPIALALKMGLDRTTSGRAASALVLRGAQALADKTVKKDDSALAGWRAEIASLVRGTLGNDKVESEIIDASYFIRAAQDVEGIGGPNFTRGIGSGAEDAIAMVIGRPIERAGVKTFLPRGMSEKDFDAKLRAFTPQRLLEAVPGGQVYVRGAPLKVEQFSTHLPEYGMRFVGRGTYVPVVRNAPVTLDPAGQQQLRLEVR